MSTHQFDPETYTGMPAGATVPSPQLIKNARMLIVGYEADPEVLESVLPPGLSPHPNNLIQMNMYRVPSAEQTSHLEPYTLTYLTVEVADHDSSAISSAEGEFPVPGRFWVGYWTDSPQMQSYTREGGGIPAQAGSCEWTTDDDELVSTLEVDGDSVIEAAVSVGDEQVDTLTGHLHYYAHRQIPDPAGGRAEINELVEFPIPFVSELFEAEVDRIDFDFPEGSRFQQFAPTDPLSTPSILHGTVTFTYPQGRCVRDYLAEGP
ncbi:acetoacetate decarboxylase family protein [Natrinema salaciae]|uniref:Acetoacetate decarboxylase n=1 Tax=Natrinema salaciae TaxID=1186196 RepID=A0A1H9NK47_9EURY|nr:acetoacetate decarboxylase family protein [Natrinema salaciae]SER36272.1 acetoacetate decarboxylase [Natrinema salaciae]